MCLQDHVTLPALSPTILHSACFYTAACGPRTLGIIRISATVALLHAAITGQLMTAVTMAMMQEEDTVNMIKEHDVD